MGHKFPVTAMQRCKKIYIPAVHVGKDVCRAHTHTVSGLDGWLIIWDDCRRPASEELPVTDDMCRIEAVTLWGACAAIEYGILW